MRLPNFLIIGASKAGTTSLFHYLGQHPEIYMSPLKEPHFFTYEDEPPRFQGIGDERRNALPVTNKSDYGELFDGVKAETAVGEASVSYLYSQKALMGIRRSIPDVRLVAILRNPVDRAYSNYLDLVWRGQEPIQDFSAALAEEENREQAGWHPFWHYKKHGFYFRYVKRYFEAFPPDQIKIFLYEDWQNDNQAVLRDLFGYLEVDPLYVSDTSYLHNQSAAPRSREFNRFLRNPGNLKRLVRPMTRRLLSEDFRISIYRTLRDLNRNSSPPLDPQVRGELASIYREDVLRLQDLLGYDLRSWLEPEESSDL